MANQFIFSSNTTILHDLLREGNSIEMIHALLRAGENPNMTNKNGDTPLHIVASKNIINLPDIEHGLQATRVLINFGANVNLKNCIGQTSLIIASGLWNCKMVELLLQAKAQINWTDTSGNTALHHALIQYGSCGKDDITSNLMLQVIQTLLRYHPELDKKNKLDQTPLMLAIRNQDFRIVQELLKRNASVNLTDIYNESAMHYALDQAHVNLDIVLELMRHGCRFNSHNLHNESPITIYIRRLLFANLDELEKAKSVFKLYLLDKNSLSTLGQYTTDTLSREKTCGLSKFIEYCTNEIKQMLQDELVPNYFVYDMAMRCFSYRDVKKTHIPFEVFDKIFDKLLKGQYPVYCDLIVSGICSPYLKKKFAEACCCMEISGSEFLNYDELYLLSFYLSHFNMFNMMLAFSMNIGCSKHFACLKCFQRYRKCTFL